MISLYFVQPRGAILPIDAHKLYKLPAGEWHVQTRFDSTDGHAVAYVQDATADDLVALSIWADAMKRTGRDCSAIIPYLPGARQDRAPYGEALSAKVYAGIINRCEFKRVVCLDPHSDVMPALLDNVAVIPLNSIGHLLPTRNYVGVIAPDIGARKRAEMVARVLKVPVYQAFKRRDPVTGVLSRFACEELPEEGRFLVVDDICDGGGTFCGLAEATGLPAARLSLWVTHGVFSGDAAHKLVGQYSAIYTTDSRTPSREMREVFGCCFTVQPVFRALANFIF